MVHDASNTPPPQTLLQIMMNGWACQAIGTLARLRIPDQLAQGPRAVGSIAEDAKVDADALHRLLRAAAMVGVAVETAPRTYGLTPVGELLRSDVSGSMRSLLDAETAPGHWLPWGRLDECIRRGRSVATETLGADVWSYYARHAAEGQAFSEGMTGLSMMALGAIGAVWQAPSAKRVVDVGGAHGAFLASVLRQRPDARGVLYDLPTVVDGARRLLQEAGVADRVELVGGDFMREVPAGGDLYLLKHIVHDWDDATVRTILSHVRRGITADGTLVIVEMLLPEDGSPSPAILLDLNMLVMLPGRERTASELRTLLASAGFEVTRVVATHSPFSLIEAKPA